MILSQIAASWAINVGEAHLNSHFLYAIVALGVYSIACTMLKTVLVFLQTFLLSGTNLTKFGCNEGAWAVVTGCTDGIGKEFARQLGKAGFNMILAARDVSRLNDISREIELMYGVKTAIQVVDFGKASGAKYAEITEELKQYEIGVLGKMNNVGTSWRFAPFFETPLDKINDMIHVNVGASVQITYAILPGMIERKCGLILNVGSFSGAFPIPMLALYSSTKAFLAHFSSALAEEVRPHNVTVEYLNAYYIVSKLSRFRQPSIFIPTPEAYVQSVLSKISLPCGSAFSGRFNSSSPYWSHALLDWLFASLFGNVPRIVMKSLHFVHGQAMRRAIIRKEARRHTNGGPEHR
ncbi:hypothetical protein NP233_g1780 [Leucocoprinus birnbaumii]|uniref:Very-long-chain 3-oxoacyl-CoA reductase n=1 Tax=Leucocoprinus birnbaumii TaxID=56174 RepID=A0AAD5YZF9_9AGAR|nr:hypothetical protein NP233_g1780 [Leucocoprinus birnbaumii]